MRISRLFWTLVATLFFGAYPLRAETTPGVYLRYDFCAHFKDAILENSTATDASPGQTVGMRSMPGFFIHPGPQGDAIARFDAVHVDDDPALHPFLLFHTGIRDGIDWTADLPNKPNGVTFSVAVNGTRLFEETLAESRWHPHALDLSPWRGQDIAVAFATNAVAGDTNYDWAVFGGAALAAVLPVVDAAAFPPEDNGLALAHVRCATPLAVSLSVGAATLETMLPAGEHWLPLDFDAFAPPVFTGGADAQLVETLAAPYLPALDVRQTELSSPLLSATRPFCIAAKIQNTGRGNCPAGTPVPGLFNVTTPDLAPGKSAWVKTGAITPKGESVTSTPAGIAHIFNVEGPCDKQKLAAPCAVVNEKGMPAAYTGNTFCRAAVFSGKDRQAYARLDLWNGVQWKRAGSLYPLASLSLNGRPAETMLLATCATDGNALVLSFTDMQKNTAQVRLEPEAAAPRIKVSAEFHATADCALYAFEGPSLLAGDRAFGAKKDFAVFSGLDYLEGDEDSSSDRDLIYPLCDRRVPALHKITSGVMAAQADNMLVALLWNPSQQWADGQSGPAARFNAPKLDTGIEYIRMGLRAPGVGEYLGENTLEAKQPFPLLAGGTVRLEWNLVLDHANNRPDDPVVKGPHRGGLLLQAYRHYFDLFGLPEPSAQPRSWNDEKALCVKGYLDAAGQADPPGWEHCAGWPGDATTGPSVPLLLLARQQQDPAKRDEILARIALVNTRALQEQGPRAMIGATNCHIILGEPAYYWGYTSETIAALRDTARALLDARENGLWVWHPPANDPKAATLGDDGGHTLGQAAHHAMLVARAARFSGDPALVNDALAALRQLDQYEIPRGAQMWECPMYQPDILAAAYAIRAYCDAYRMTGDDTYLAQARYWAWTGLPFLYFWELPGYPTMRYNVISVIGSTFHTHSWLGMPVVWCGLVHAYALQDLAGFDNTLDWNRIAQGITTSAMHQQYTEGPHAGTYPDSWNMVTNTPNPADINPENIIVNECRLRAPHLPGRLTPEPAFQRIASPDGAIFINSSATIAAAESTPVLKLRLENASGWTAYTTLAPIPRPAAIEGTGQETPGAAALSATTEGWQYDESQRLLTLKTTFTDTPAAITLRLQ